MRHYTWESIRFWSISTRKKNPLPHDKGNEKEQKSNSARKATRRGEIEPHKISPPYKGTSLAGKKKQKKNTMEKTSGTMGMKLPAGRGPILLLKTELALGLIGEISSKEPAEGRGKGWALRPPNPSERGPPFSFLGKGTGRRSGSRTNLNIKWMR